MKLPKLVVLFVLLSVSPLLAAEWIPLLPDQQEGSAPEITLIKSNAVETQIEITLPGFYLEETSEGYSLYVPEWPMTLDTGMPHLPCAAMLMALPEQSPVSVEIVDSDATFFNNCLIRPTPEPTTDSQSPQPEPARPWQGAYPGVAGDSMTLGAIGNLPVTALRVYPFRSDPSSGQLTVFSRMVVSIHHDHGTTAWSHVPMTERQVSRCANSLINFSAVPHTPNASKGKSEPNYVVITKSTLVPAVQPLVDWRAMTGFHTDVRTVSNASSQDVKDIILEYPDVEYVLLVGDTGDIPLGYFGGTPGDHWYACTTGGSNPDIYADLSIGRLCGSTVTRISHQVDKILDYEKDPPLGNWLKHTILVPHRENYPQKYTLCKNQIATSMSSWSDWTVEKCYGGESGVNNALVKQIINAGTNIVNYRGHGDTQEWWSWNNYGESFYNSDVASLNNGEMRPIVFNIACYNGNISSDSLCEEWLDAPGGATAALGATEPSYTDPNHDFDKALYECIFSLGITDIGGMLDYADNKILGLWGGIGETNVKMYLWCGDPAMKIWLDIPDTGMTATHNATINTGMQVFDVFVEDSGTPVVGATVSAFKENEIYESAITGSDGHALLTIWPTTPGTMLVAVTAGNYLPYESTVNVDSMPGPIPDIKIDGADGPLNRFHDQRVSITVSLDPADQTGVPHDWWLFAKTSTLSYWWTQPNTWTTTETLAHDGPLVEITDYLISRVKIPAGDWVFYFVIDELNGNFEGTFIDVIEVKSW